MLSTLVTERREITRLYVYGRSANICSNDHVSGSRSIATKLLCRPRRHTLVIVAMEARKAEKATVAMEVAATAGATTTSTVIHDHYDTRGMSTMVTIVLL